MIYEIVIVKAWHYLKDDQVMMPEYAHVSVWWFEQPDMTPEKAFSETEWRAMPCEAFRFDFEFVPNPDVRHFDTSFMHGWHENQIWLDEDAFEEWQPQLLEIARRYVTADDPGPGVNFYVLFQVEWDEWRDDDGHCDDVQVYPTLLGELDFTKLPLALKAVQP